MVCFKPYHDLKEGFKNFLLYLIFKVNLYLIKCQLYWGDRRSRIHQKLLSGKVVKGML